MFCTIVPRAIDILRAPILIIMILGRVSWPDGRRTFHLPLFGPPRAIDGVVSSCDR